MIITNITCTSCYALSTVDGQNHRKSYVNSTVGRAEFLAECAETESFAEVLAAWGDAPTVEDMPPIDPPPSGPTLEERMAAVEEATEALIRARLEV